MNCVKMGDDDVMMTSKGRKTLEFALQYHNWINV